METITAENVKLTLSGSNHVTINQTGIDKEKAIREISNYQQEMIKEINKLDQYADEDRLLANLIRGNINASSNIMKIIRNL